MFYPGDVCIVNKDAENVLYGLYKTLIGKRVVVMSSDTVNDRYPIEVLHADREIAFHWSNQILMRKDLLTKQY